MGLSKNTPVYAGFIKLRISDVFVSSGLKVWIVSVWGYLYSNVGTKLLVPTPIIGFSKKRLFETSNAKTLCKLLKESASLSVPVSKV